MECSAHCRCVLGCPRSQSCSPLHCPPLSLLSLRVMSSDPDSLTSGSITLPFTRSDLEDLLELETSVLRKRRAAKAAAGASSAAAAAAEDEVPAQETAAVGDEVAQLSALISQGGGGEDEWKELVQMHDAVLYNGLLAIMVSPKQKTRRTTDACSEEG